VTPAELEAIRARNWGETEDTDELLMEVDRLTDERDLAVAHDRQPYPTAWAYEQACRALADARADVERITVRFNAAQSIRVSRLDMEVYYIGERDERRRIRAAIEALPEMFRENPDWQDGLVDRAAVLAAIEREATE